MGHTVKKIEVAGDIDWFISQQHALLKFFNKTVIYRRKRLKLTLYFVLSIIALTAITVILQYLQIIYEPIQTTKWMLFGIIIFDVVNNSFELRRCFADSEEFEKSTGYMVKKIKSDNQHSIKIDT